jgi:DNA-binding GntR family transcriptional regulator
LNKRAKRRSASADGIGSLPINHPVPAQSPETLVTQLELIADALRTSIIHGEIEAGSPLRQDRIAQQFGVSHIPVREALRCLSGEGLVELVHNRGAFVSRLSSKLAWELTEFRALLEGQMMRWAGPNLKISDLEKAELLIAQIEDCDEPTRILELNMAYHSVLLTPAARPHFQKSIDVARLNLFRYWRKLIGKKPPTLSYLEQHRDTVRLLRNGNINDAAALTERHIMETGNLVVEYLRNQDL